MGLFCRAKPVLTPGQTVDNLQYLGYRGNVPVNDRRCLIQHPTIPFTACILPRGYHADGEHKAADGIRWRAY